MRSVKIFVVLFGSLVITALGIDASDTFTGARTTLLASILGVQETPLCPAGMTDISDGVRTTCVDMYEAGVGGQCPIIEPHSVQDTLQNMQTSGCVPVSATGVYPWRFVSYRLAEQLCARAGKTLITTDMWYKAALGTPDTDSACGIDMQTVSVGGRYKECVSGSGAYDMIGNVWELVQGEVIDGKMQAVQLPESGYVSMVNDAGVPTATAFNPNPLYGSDYFWREVTGTYAVMRGGYYKGQQDAGLYNVQAGITQDFAGEAVGFRCMLVR